ncbi:MAG TPA: YbbC/YhhH family protein [Bacteroidia bacterium]|jgi:hypothetical protein|nr:YbbC/YhhH family protein [Bacteroidia bacterium]
MKLLSIIALFSITFFLSSYRCEKSDVVCFKYKQTIEDTSFVPNAETAISIAKAIWKPIYGWEVNQSKPFIATLRDDGIWEVKGTYKKRGKGGVPYIRIQKSDGKIIQVWHTK